LIEGFKSNGKVVDERGVWMVKLSDERDDEAVWCLHSVECASRGSRLLQPLVVGEE